MLKLEQGDLFERSKADWLRKRFPGNGRFGYESVWAQFIGNDGNNQLIRLHGLDADEERRRQAFAEAHYSMALFAYLFEETASDLSKLCEPVEGIDSYITIIGQFSSMIAHLGQVCDMVGKVGIHLKAGDSIHTHIESLQTLRSQAIHSVKIPMHQDYMGLRIPIICDQKDPTEDTWSGKSKWEDVNLLRSSQYLADFAKETQDRLFEGINLAYPIIHSHAAKSFLKPRESSKAYNIYAANSEASTNPPSSGNSGFSGLVR